MTSTLPIAQCTGKTRPLAPAELAALVQCHGKDRLTGAQAHALARRKGKQFSPYRCPHCGGNTWHVGHPPFRKGKQ